jgi:hypothetical protein
VDFAFSVFKLVNRRGYSVPFFNFGYTEADSGTEWRFICGGTRAYMVRHATPLVRDMDEQAAESHFMMRRITAALLMSGFGLYHAEPAGRVLFTDVWGDLVNWTPYIDQPAHVRSSAIPSHVAASSVDATLSAPQRPQRC